MLCLKNFIWNWGGLKVPMKEELLIREKEAKNSEEYNNYYEFVVERKSTF